MRWEHIYLDVSDSIATVTLNRPDSLNAFAGTMREDLLAAIQEASNCSRVLILAGAGKAFCSGGDVRAMGERGRGGPEVLYPEGEARRCLSAVSCPSQPSLPLMGSQPARGFSLALACDLRIASRTARLGATFSRIGLHPDWGWDVPSYTARRPGSGPRSRAQRQARRFR